MMSGIFILGVRPEPPSPEKEAEMRSTIKKGPRTLGLKRIKARQRQAFAAEVYAELIRTSYLPLEEKYPTIFSGGTPAAKPSDLEESNSSGLLAHLRLRARTLLSRLLSLALGARE